MRVSVAGEPRDLTAGQLIALAPGVRHAVRAEADGAFLLTIAAPRD
jgi:quercetin dioxygenase-like cupin family protein